MKTKKHKKKTLGYILNTSGESVDDSLGWYDLHGWPKSEKAIMADIKDLFDNCPVRSALLYKIEAIPLARVSRRKK